MTSRIVAFAAGALIAGLLADAQAQTADKTSLVDSNRAASIAGAGTSQSPGTVGAMNAVAHGLATSPEDIRRQQEGRSSALDGDRTVEGVGATAIIGQSPGTVGAAPGN